MTCAGSGTISPGLRVTWLPAVIATVPVDALLTAAPPSEAALPESLVPAISIRPPGIDIGGIEGQISQGYRLGSALLMPPPDFAA
jgi:hypothetical protein